ncbi:hypothetical protein HaLaN_31774, partial [Haematococcus lacustris]
MLLVLEFLAQVVPLELKRRQLVVRQGQEQRLGSGQGQRQEEGQP